MGHSIFWILNLEKDNQLKKVRLEDKKEKIRNQISLNGVAIDFFYKISTFFYIFRLNFKIIDKNYKILNF